MKKLNDRVALITGAASGIGREIAQEFAQAGACVALIDIDKKGGQAAAEEIQSVNGAAAAFACDVTDQAAVHRTVQAVVEQFGGLHILVNNAGISPLCPIEDISLQDWERVLAINLTGPFLMIQVCLPFIKDAGNKGRMINMGSLAGQAGGISVGLHYTASKGGLMAITRQLAKILAPFGATANSIAPGTTETPLVADWPQDVKQSLIKKIPLGRLGTPGDIAQAALYLASDAAGFITGATINVNGGMFIA